MMEGRCRGYRSLEFRWYAEWQSFRPLSVGRETHPKRCKSRVVATSYTRSGRMMNRVSRVSTCSVRRPSLLPTYQWSYFTVSNGSWLNIAGATSNTISVAYNSAYYNNDSSVKFRCVVNGIKEQSPKSARFSCRRVRPPATEVRWLPPVLQALMYLHRRLGDVVLLDNTTDGTAEVYGEAHVYNGEVGSH